MTDEELYQLETRVFERLRNIGRSKEYLRDWALGRAKFCIDKPVYYNKYIDLAEKYSESDSTK